MEKIVYISMYTNLLISATIYLKQIKPDKGKKKHFENISINTYQYIDKLFLTY